MNLTPFFSFLDILTFVRDILKSRTILGEYACGTRFNISRANSLNFKKKKFLQSSKGVTLLELVIALTILATLTVLTQTSIQQALESKKKIQEQLDEMSKVRDALRIIEKDINMAFHYQDPEMDFRENLKKQLNTPQTTGTTGGQGQGAGGPGGRTNPPPQQQPYKDEKEELRKANRIKPETHFMGSENELHFPTLNSGRMSDTIRQGDMIKVGYLLESCSRPGKNKTASNCLIRKQGVIVDGDITKSGENTILLENVSEFKLRYKSKEKKDWVSDWKTTNSEAGIQGKFPSLVEVSLTTEKGTENKKKKISMQIVASVRFPNNEKPGEQKGANAGAQGGNQGGVPGGGQGGNQGGNQGGTQGER